jgi:NAD(P)-dependent dehydrogenase (short-subunit alcohol dehydrogenase family)
MDLNLAGRVVIVTGASKGIGYACAEAFAAEGAKVALVSRNQTNLDAALARFPRGRSAPIAIAADMTSYDAAEEMVARVEKTLGEVEVLVNSAGAARRYAPDDLNAQAWHDAMDAKFFSYIHPIDAALKRMLPRERGTIVNIIGAGGKVATPVHLPGGAANSALMLATVGLASAFGPKGIRVNGINPGATEAELLSRSETRIPLKRYGTPEEIARVAVFLASEQASYVTGAIVPMDGGASAVI